jgi:hypothetical protein
VDTHQVYTEQERRAGIDRRNWECHYEFPYIDGHGMLVTDDRRQNSERRGNTQLVDRR